LQEQLCSRMLIGACNNFYIRKLQKLQRQEKGFQGGPKIPSSLLRLGWFHFPVAPHSMISAIKFFVSYAFSDRIFMWRSFNYIQTKLTIILSIKKRLEDLSRTLLESEFSLNENLIVIFKTSILRAYQVVTFTAGSVVANKISVLINCNQFNNQ
jgi:hypothetical protein